MWHGYTLCKSTYAGIYRLVAAWYAIWYNVCDHRGHIWLCIIQCMVWRNKPATLGISNYNNYVQPENYRYLRWYTSWNFIENHNVASLVIRGTILSAMPVAWPVAVNCLSNLLKGLPPSRLIRYFASLLQIMIIAGRLTKYTRLIWHHTMWT